MFIFFFIEGVFHEKNMASSYISCSSCTVANNIDLKFCKACGLSRLDKDRNQQEQKMKTRERLLKLTIEKRVQMLYCILLAILSKSAI